ncbi:type 1 periplasmic-binding domain-containing protein [Mycoplasma yeatsii]|uniref:ribose/galactose ABC transporter substrate-binding protein n=1 Tax=Mycoplasma yeatsii TaxID=51365 RepID=UPI0005B2405D|nr:ribose/galactose ABC transporter substrate-binding protein [Mycoplasma yeatsii]AJM72058.1 putative sugar ABC transporter substrate-binding lipoprotein [Mycoplasma yeatsii GM274B]
MKKLLTALTALVSTAAPISATVSCKKTEPAEGVLGQRVVLVTDGGNIRDHSFNEGSWEAILQYGMNIHKKFGVQKEEEARTLDYASSIGENQWDDKNKDFGEINFEKAKLKNNSFVEAREGASASDFRNAYRTAASTKQADALFLAGFKHANTIDDAIKIMKGKTVVFLDFAYKAKNVISIVYKSELAGFNAGWDALMWANLPKMTSLNSGEFAPEVIEKSQAKKLNEIPVQGSIRGKNYVSIGMFGGLSNKNAVDNFLWGLLAAMNLYNNVMAGQTVKLTDVKGNEVEYTLQKVAFANGKGNESQRQNVNSIDGLGKVDWFSGNFEAGGATRSTVMPKLFENEADIIFPVAGPQTNDVLNYKEGKGKNFKPYVIGVDADQVTSIGDDRTGTNKRFITSAKKNIISASIYALERAKSLQEAIVGDKKYDNSIYKDDIKDDNILDAVGADWSVSSSRSSKQKWDAGTDKITNSANLAVQSINYEKENSKTISDNLKSVLSETGGEFNDYLNSNSLNNFVNQAKDILGKDKKWTQLKLNDNGIAGIEDYINLLNQTNMQKNNK